MNPGQTWLHGGTIEQASLSRPPTDEIVCRKPEHARTVLELSSLVQHRINSSPLTQRSVSLCLHVKSINLVLFHQRVAQGAGGITAAQLGKSAAGMADPSPLKTLEEGVPRAVALAQLEQVSCSTRGVSVYGLEGGLHAVMMYVHGEGRGE